MYFLYLTDSKWRTKKKDVLLTFLWFPWLQSPCPIQTNKHVNERCKHL